MSLLAAAKENDMIVIRRLLLSGGDVNSKDGYMQTPLHKSVRCHWNTLQLKGDSNKNKKAAAEALLNAGANVNAQDRYGDAPLHCLTSSSWFTVKTVKLLLNFGANVNLKNDLGDIPLVYAVKEGNAQVVKLLIEHGSNVRSTNKNGSTPLHEAARCNDGKSHFEIAEELLSKGADINARDERGNAPLHFLLGKASLKIIRLFLKYKADINARNSEGEVPLFGAVNGRNMNELDNGVDFWRLPDGLDPRYFYQARAHIKTSHLKTIETVLKVGADVNARGARGQTPFQCVLKVANLRLTKLFLSLNADVNVRDDQGETPLFNAARNGRLEVVQLLLERVSANVKAKNGLTPLHLASEKSNLEVIKCLIRHGADVEALDANGHTPLMHALHRSRPVRDAVEFLLEHTDISKVDTDGRNILSLNSSNHSASVILKHLAKLQYLGLLSDPRLVGTIYDHVEYAGLFEKFTRELEKARSTRLSGCWVSFFNLLVDNNRMLKNYAGNMNLVNEFLKRGCLKKFPSYGATMRSNMEAAIVRRNLFDKSAVVLSNCLLNLNPTHLIIRDTLDHLSTEDFSKLLALSTK